MSEKAVHLCKWGPDAYAERFEKLAKIVVEPKYVCLRCGRAAAKKKWLCKPKALD